MRKMLKVLLTAAAITAGSAALALDVQEAKSAGWVGDGYDGVHVFAPTGERIGQIRLPEICSNVCFGGSKRNRLFMTGSQSLYAVYVGAVGAHIA